MHEPIPILHLDDDLVVISKPAGLMVHRDKFSQDERVVLQTLGEQLGKYLYPVHRLDRNTSGVLCFALSSPMARALHDNLASDLAHKEYVTLARGQTPESFVSERPLTSERGEKQPARTDFRRLACFFRCSLLTATISTGRLHQIRRHLAHLAHQIIGDTSYGKGRINAFFRAEHGLPRMVLHARVLRVPHPRTGTPLEIVDPLPDDLRGFLSGLPDAPIELLARL